MDRFGNTEEMEEVAREEGRPFVWKFNPSKEKYLQVMPGNKPRSWLFGSSIPDPAKLEEERKHAKATGRLQPFAREKADPVTVKLWEHWNKYLASKA